MSTNTKTMELWKILSEKRDTAVAEFHEYLSSRGALQDSSAVDVQVSRELTTNTGISTIDNLHQISNAERILCLLADNEPKLYKQLLSTKSNDEIINELLTWWYSATFDLTGKANMSYKEIVSSIQDFIHE